MRQIMDGVPKEETPDTGPSSSCPECNDTGWVMVFVPEDLAPSEEMEIPVRSVARRCKCAEERIARYKIEQLPERFRDCCIAPHDLAVPPGRRYEFKNQDQRETLDALLDNPTGSYYIWGPYGAGKTHLAAALYKIWLDNGIRCEFRTIHDLLAELTDRVIHGKPSMVEDGVEHVKGFGLVLDDLDKYKVTDYRQELLFWLFDTIYGKQLPLVVTSNFSLRDLVEQEIVTPAIVRRIDDHCRVLRV